jgi:TadE-like protein
MVEFLIVLPSLLLIVLGIIQFSLIFQAGSILRHATFIGARQGALSSGKMESIKDGVAAGLTPLFMRVDPKSVLGLEDLVKARLISTIEIFNPNTAKIERLSPTDDALDAHEVGGEVPNDNLMYRPPELKGGQSIQDANLLKIRVSYCFKLVVPFVNQLIYGLAVGLKEVKGLTGVSFDPANSTETNKNLCTDINKVKAQATDIVVNDINNRAGPLAPLTGSLSSAAATIINNAFDNVPLLNWNLGGVRIPIVAEAIIRMQTPFIMEDNGSP